MKKLLRGFAPALVLLLLIGCAKKNELTPEMVELQKQNQLTTMMVAQIESMGEAIAAQAAKDDCTAQVIAVPGKSIENMAGFTFTCNNGGDKGEVVEAYGETMAKMVGAMTWKPKTAGVAWAETFGVFFDKGFSWATTATPWLATYGITKAISDDYSSITKSNNDAWGKAIESAHVNGGSETITTTTTTTSDIVRETTNNTTTSNIETHTDTFGSGNTITGNVNNPGGWYQSPSDYSITENPFVPSP